MPLTLHHEDSFVQLGGIGPVVAVHSVKPLQAVTTAPFTLAGDGVSVSLPVDSTDGFNVGDRVMLVELGSEGYASQRAHLEVKGVSATSLVVARYAYANSLAANVGSVFTPGSELVGQTRLPGNPAGVELGSIELSCAHNSAVVRDSASDKLAESLLSRLVPLAYVGIFDGIDIDLGDRVGRPLFDGSVVRFAPSDLDRVRIFSVTNIKYAPNFDLVYRGVG